MSVTIQENPIVTYRTTASNFGRTSLHLIQEEIVQTTAYNKYLLTDTDVTVLQTIVQYSPTLLQYPEGTFNILPHTLQVC